jgi:hypothetical protein
MLPLFRCPGPNPMDRVVHLTLGLAVLVAVIFSLGEALNFCAQLDQIAERLSSDRPAVVSSTEEQENTGFTNATAAGTGGPSRGSTCRTNSPSAVPVSEGGTGVARPVGLLEPPPRDRANSAECWLSCGERVWKPAIRQTWKSALR